MNTALRASIVRSRRPLNSMLKFSGRLGFGRQGALAATRRMFPSEASTPVRRVLSLMAGSTLIGTGVALLTQARLGLSPYDVLVSGLQPRLGISFGQTVWAVSAVLFALAAILGQRATLWGLTYVLANGVAIDAVAGSINSPDSIVGRVLFVGAALVSLSSGISLVVHSASTGGAFELLMKAGEMRGLDRRMVRTSLELGVLLLGISLGGSFGPATFAVALLIGPLMGIVSQGFADHSVGRSARLNPETPRAL